MSNPNACTNITMQVACPECERQMVLHVGLAPDTTNNMIECPKCHNRFVPLVPGPVIRGPFQADEPRLKKQKNPPQVFPDWLAFLRSAR
jgi:hypothetical protein